MFLSTPVELPVYRIMSTEKFKAPAEPTVSIMKEIITMTHLRSDDIMGRCF